MFVYIWERIAQASTSWHPEGGLVVVAPSLLEARAMANDTDGVTLANDEMPDHVILVTSA